MKKRHRELVKHLTMREIKARYKQSFLGLWWIILNPFFQMIILSLVFSQVLRFENLGVAYPIFLFAGLLPWIFFETTLTHATSILETNSSIIKQVYFPREILVLSVLIAKGFDFVMAASLFFVSLIFFNVPFTWFMLWTIVIFAVQFLLTYGIALLLASLNLLYRDIQFLFALVIKLWFYLTPVIYPIEAIPEKWRLIFQLNPMSGIISSYRQVTLFGSAPDYYSLLVGFLSAFVIFSFSFFIFKELEKIFADVV